MSLVFPLITTSLMLEVLGKEMFSYIPLGLTVNRYIGLLAMVITATISRFVGIEYYKGNVRKANSYYGSGFLGLLFILGFSLSVSVLFYIFLEDELIVAGVNLLDQRIFFSLTLFTGIFLSISGALGVPFFIKNKFFVIDSIDIIMKTMLVILIIVFSNILDIKLYSFLYFCCAGFNLLSTLMLGKIFAKELRVSLDNVRRKFIIQQSSLAKHSIVNAAGAMLYTSFDILVVRYFLGAESTTNYGIAVQIGLLIPVLSGSLSKLLNPRIIDLVANERHALLGAGIFRWTRYIVFLTLISWVGFNICGARLIKFWLGEFDEQIFYYASLIMLGQILHQSGTFSFMHLQAANRLRLTSRVTVALGMVNLLLSIVLVQTNLRAYGVILATIISVLLKAVLFNNWYSFRLLGVAIIFKDIKPLINLLIFSVLTVLLAHILPLYFNFRTTQSLEIVVLFWALIIFGFICLSFLVGFNKVERNNIILRLKRITKYNESHS